MSALLAALGLNYVKLVMTLTNYILAIPQREYQLTYSKIQNHN